MSYTQRSYGYIAVLENPFTKEQRDDLIEEFWEKGIDSKIGLTYDGGCVYYDFGQDTDERDVYCTEVGKYPHEDKLLDVLELWNKFNFSVDSNTIKPFNCIYYNGGDNPIDMLTAEQVINNHTSK